MIGQRELHTGEIPAERCAYWFDADDTSFGTQRVCMERIAASKMHYLVDTRFQERFSGLRTLWLRA